MAISDILQAFNQLPKRSPYRLYALHSFMFLFYFTGDDSRKIWTTAAMLDAVREESDLGQEFFDLLKNQVNNGMPKDPRIGDDCLYHCHEAGEECLVKEKKEDGNSKV
ncbi:hypothetical protein OCU04_002247 [Sclerotinia nivalis]|uniref:Uncharacterized protein n=1 Tax=Sclerotinia nivalis TaxID=352851 RepID=A0A9X0DS70_9HELO|nr:hypothetical protein OCU04_002247 [Sclerotinia nivalis]